MPEQADTMAERADIVPSVKPDLPAVQDFLGFAPYAQTLFDIISDDDTQTPLTVGIFGSWGSGKTSLMKMIEGRLEKLRQDQRKSEASGSGRKYLTIWFNAWLYSRDEVLWRSLILRVLAELRREVAHDPKARTMLDEIEAHLYRTVGPTSLGELSIGGNALVSGSQQEAEFKLPMTMGLGLLKEIAQARAEASGPGDVEALAGVTALMQAVDRMRTDLDRERVEALEVFRRDFLTLVKKYVSPGVLVVFVDDLDRCLPDKAVEVLEAIKLFFDVEGCIFVLGIDREVVERGIRIKYKDYELAEEGGPPPISGARYLEKIVQIPFQLPPIDRSAMEGYVAKMAPRLLELDPRCDDVFTVGMEPNPRRVKRTLNIFLLLWRLSRNHPKLRDQIKPVRLAKMVVIQLHHPDLFNLLPRDPNRLINLEKRFREEKEREGAEAGLEAERALVRPTDLEAAFLSNIRLRELLTLHDLNEPDANFVGMEPAQVLEYVHLSHTAAEAWESRVSGALMLEPQLKRIPAGKFLMGIPEEEMNRMAMLCEGESMGADRDWLLAQTPQHELELPTFDIGQYPVTNAEYEAFVKASEGRVSPPRHWEEGKVTPELASHPVVNVSWQDAMAYCDWLSERTGQQYRLPTEAEWEKAASWDFQTNKKRLYPWGDEWNADLCNNKENGPGSTVLVGQYSQAGGDSSYGVSDMAGNVWEWTLSKWGRDQNKPSFAYPYDGSDGREAQEGTEYRVTRGGCFYDGPGWSHSSARFPYGPLDVVYYIGFRVVRVIGKGDSDGAS